MRCRHILMLSKPGTARADELDLFLDFFRLFFGFILEAEGFSFLNILWKD
ncbi:MAG: hypothetical protein R6V12_19900 [Candidatus Hydrogenedentota bacterium]